jgi:hypothetical protein
MDEFRQRIT